MSELRLRADRLHWLESDGEVIALDEQSLVYLNANPAGAVLWQALAKAATRDELVRRILAEFDVDEATAGADVDRFLADLDARGLLERSGA
jgi:hypothetical protein